MTNQQGAMQNVSILPERPGLGRGMAVSRDMSAGHVAFDVEPCAAVVLDSCLTSVCHGTFAPMQPHEGTGSNPPGFACSQCKSVRCAQQLADTLDLHILIVDKMHIWSMCCNPLATSDDAVSCVVRADVLLGTHRSHHTSVHVRIAVATPSVAKHHTQPSYAVTLPLKMREFPDTRQKPRKGRIGGGATSTNAPLWRQPALQASASQLQCAWQPG